MEPWTTIHPSVPHFILGLHERCNVLVDKSTSKEDIAMGANTPRMPERVSRDIDTRIARIVNPVILNVAGTGCYSVSLLKHVGRRSGREYATPGAAIPPRDGVGFSLRYRELSR